MARKRRGADGVRRAPAATRKWPPLTVTRSALLVEGSDQAFRALIQDLLTMSHQIQALRGILAEGLGVTEPQYRVFLAIAQLAGRQGVRVNRVAGHLRVSGAFVTMETRKLARLGYVEKHPDPGDGRSVLLTISPSGRQAFERFAGQPQRLNNELFRGFSTRAFRQLGALARRLVANGERALALAPSMHARARRWSRRASGHVTRT